MLRATILTDSQRAVKQCARLFDQLRLTCEAPFAVGSTGSRTAYAADNVGIEVLEVSWLSRVRQARGAPPLGSLVAFGATTAASTSVGALVHRCWRDGPGLALGGFEFAPGARGRLREVVLSSSGVEASARELCDAARRYHGATSASPGVLRSGAVDFRVQPLSLGTSALVLRTESVADALEELRACGARADRVGHSAFGDPGQLVLGLPWAAGGVELRLCERLEPASQFHESHSAIADSPDVIPDLQSKHLAGAGEGADDASVATARDPIGHCWIEAHAMLKRPHKLFLAK